MPASGAERYAVLQWLMFQMGGFGPMLGQAHHFTLCPEPVPYAIERYRNEARRLYTVLDNQLAGRDYVAGDYSIADMALYPWATRHEWQEIDLADFPNVARWMTTLAARPAVAKGWQNRVTPHCAAPGHLHPHGWPGRQQASWMKCWREWRRFSPT